MGKDVKKVPKRRFKQFQDAGDWEQRKLGDLYTERNEQGDNSLQILSVSIHTGVSDRELTADGLGKKVLRSEDKSTYKHVYAGDLIFNMMRAWQGAIGVAKNEGMTSPAYISAIPNDEVYSLFMNYLLRRKDAINQINNLSYGVTDFRKRLYWDSFTCVTCLIPCIDEQKRITEVFENLDNLITLHQRKLEKVKELKQAYLSEMFPAEGETIPKRRFKGFTGDWEQRKFDIVFDCTIPNNTLSRAELSYDEGIVLNVHYGDILVKYGSVLDVQRDEIPHIPQSCREDYSGALLQEGDIIIADTAEDETTGKACEIDNLQGSSIVSGLHTMVCRPRKQMASGYLGYYLNSNAYHHQLLPLMQGIKVLSLSRSNIQKTSVSYPAEVEEQQLIASYFKRFDNLVTLHQRKLEKLKNLKKAYLGEMFV